MKTISNKLIKDYILGRCNVKQMELVADKTVVSEEDEKILFSLKDMYLSHQFENIFADEQHIDEAEGMLFRAINANERKVQRVRMMRIMRYAAILLIAFLLGGVGLYAVLGSVNTISENTTAHEIKEIVLPDSTHVWLNTSSELTYPKQFSKNERLVKLKGEALFDVTKNAECPFVVEGDGVRTRVFGTKFNMNTRADVNAEEVTLLEGCVEVEDVKTEAKLRLSPNQKVRVDKIAHHMETENVYAPLAALWHDNYIPFENMDLKAIAGILEKVYKVHIHVDGNVSGHTYTGEVKHYGNISQVLHDLAYTIPFYSSKLKDGTILISAP